MERYRENKNLIYTKKKCTQGYVKYDFDKNGWEHLSWMVFIPYWLQTYEHEQSLMRRAFEISVGPRFAFQKQNKWAKQYRIYTVLAERLLCINGLLYFCKSQISQYNVLYMASSNSTFQIHVFNVPEYQHNWVRFIR